MFENLTEAVKELEPKLFREFHRAAVKAVEGLKLNEVIVIKALQDVDDSFTYRYLGYNSLKTYCIEALGLSEPQSGIYISVARKAKNLPSLQQALEEGEVTVSKVVRVMSVINNENQGYWVDLVQHSSKREVEKEVAKANPKVVGPEKVRFLTDTVMEMQIAVSDEEFNLLTRSQEIISQKAKRPVSFREVLKIIALDYNEKHDPLEREKRRQNRRETHVKKAAAKSKTDIGNGAEVDANGAEAKNDSAVKKDCPGSVEGQKSTARKPIKRTLKDKVLSRDGGRCTYHLRGKQCNQRVFLHVHHIELKENGGADEISNLQTLCSGHHQMLHGDFH